MDIFHVMALPPFHRVSSLVVRSRNTFLLINTTAVAGLGQAYGLGPRVTAFLAAYAIAVDGNILDQTWSIGGPLPTIGLGGIIGNGQG